MRHSGTFEYVTIPLRLSNTPETFQRAVDNILTKYIWKTYLIYVDEVIIYSKNVREHIHHVDEIISTFGVAGVTPNVKSVISSNERSNT